MWAAFAAKERARQPSAPVDRGPALPIFGRDCPARARPWQAYPSRPQTARVPRRPIFTPKSPSISTLWRLCWPVATSHPFSVPVAIHLVDAETKHPIRKDVDDMRCTPRKTAGTLNLARRPASKRLYGAHWLPCSSCVTPAWRNRATISPGGASSQHPSARVRRQTTRAGATCR